ncbi:hypothetical protein D915_007231 [Fasciola hepatica]|uniref:Uncharacterized protein n=1 Tax=Fasciola hepatica TaxID=6192 RepID=A0A4E0R2P4_FASHE|nr:hypothetical protein D915_007231 [Fasciola hepatica]
MMANCSDVYPGSALPDIGITLTAVYLHGQLGHVVCWWCPLYRLSNTKFLPKRDKTDVYQYDPCQPPYLIGPAGGLTLPDWMLIWKRSFIHVGDKMVVCYPEDSWNDFRAPKMICYCAIERDPLVGFDLGNRVPQVITYQTEDNIFIGIGPQRQGIVVSRDLEHWTGWSMSTSRYETDGKHLQNATYLPWEKTDKFNKNLVGKKCSAYASGDWNFCYSGIFYKNKQVASWDDATDVKSAKSK